mmetsp:Transcript_82865/g.146430  ORF Transcript_82865/g.146430 Transcript_82865/m.146430 type:complete len:670 (+) Transcript_82865:52-2061(+)
MASPSKVYEVMKTYCTEAAAAYAILWKEQDGKMVVVNHHDVDGSFAVSCKDFDMPVGDGAVGLTYATKEDLLISDVSQGAYLRADLAKQHGVTSIACFPHRGFVIEVGTKSTWTMLPAAIFPEASKGVEDKVESKHPGTQAKLAFWNPEDAQFWEEWGSKIAWKNLLISIPNLTLMFATWIMWSIIATQIQASHEDDPSAYAFADLGLDPGDSNSYKATVLMLPSLAGLAGATLRVPNSFLVAVCGGKTHNAMNSTLAILPMILIGVTLSSKDCPFWLLCIVAPCCGFGGGAFASSMSSISFFFPKRSQGLALGLNAGIGNLGVSLTQLLIPLVCSAAVFGGSAIGAKYIMNAGWFYVILLSLAAIPAWMFMNYMPNHGSASGSMKDNVLAYLRLEGLGFLGVAVGVGLFILANPLVQGNPALIILRSIILAVVACLTTLVSMRYLSSPEIKEKLLTQSAIFKDKHTWLQTWLYIMTFGSFIGYSSAFPALIKNVFGYLPNGDINPNAPSVAAFAWMGACVGSLARPIGGLLSDRWSGATVTHWGTIIEIIFTVLVGVIVRFASNSETPEDYFLPFLFSFLMIFASTGSSNGSTFRQMSVIFPPEQAGPVLGWTSAVAAYGAAVFPACFSAGIKGDFIDIVMYVFAVYYASCLAVNYWYYYRNGAEKPC